MRSSPRSAFSSMPLGRPYTLLHVRRSVGRLGLTSLIIQKMERGYCGDILFRESPPGGRDLLMANGERNGGNKF